MSTSKHIQFAGGASGHLSLGTPGGRGLNRRRFLAAGAAAVCLGRAATAQPIPPAPGAERSLQQLLDEAGVPYFAGPENGELRYHVRLESEAGSTDLTARELTMRWQRRDGSAVKAAYFYLAAVRFPETFAPAALLKLLADLNNGLVCGNVGIGKYGVFYSNSMWLRTADPEMLADVLNIAHNQTLDVRRQCEPFVGHT